MLFLGFASGMMDLASIYSGLLRFILIATLLYSIRRHELLLMQGATVGLLVLLVVQLIIAPTLRFGLGYIVYVWATHFDELISFILIMCAELILLIDSQKLAAG